jgi:hypothetical protein
MRQVLVLLLFGGFFLGTLVEIALMLERKRQGGRLERFRLVFFFVACLMMVCLVPLWIFEKLSGPVLASNLAVVLANALGYALTYSRQRKEGEERLERGGVRTYVVYYQGAPYGLVTREGFERLMAHQLLKRQRTVELVEDFQAQARRQGVQIQLFRNKEGTQTLIRVVEGENRGGTAPERDQG